MNGSSLAGGKEFVDLFMVVVQFGSILAVLVLYFHKLNPFSTQKNQKQKRDTLSLWGKVLIATVPAGIIGLLFEEKNQCAVLQPDHRGHYADCLWRRVYRGRKPEKKGTHSLLCTNECPNGSADRRISVLALIPGTSRSGATILGAVMLGCTRTVAAEFSFFLAIPVMLGASGLKLIKYADLLVGPQLLTLLVGTVVAFCGFAVCHPVF